VNRAAVAQNGPAHRTIDSDVALRREEIEGLRKPGGPTEGGIEREQIDEVDDEIIRG
jgi:hypothetical protein